LHNQTVRTLAVPGLARLAFSGIVDTLQLPDYRWSVPTSMRPGPRGG
jgi:hypothetical protein